MGTPPSARDGWNNSRGEPLAVATARSSGDSKADVRVSIVFSASMNESGQVPDEEVIELVFAVGNH